MFTERVSGCWPASPLTAVPMAAARQPGTWHTRQPTVPPCPSAPTQKGTGCRESIELPRPRQTTMRVANCASSWPIPTYANTCGTVAYRCSRWSDRHIIIVTRTRGNGMAERRAASGEREMYNVFFSAVTPSCAPAGNSVCKPVKLFPLPVVGSSGHLLCGWPAPVRNKGAAACVSSVLCVSLYSLPAPCF